MPSRIRKELGALLPSLTPQERALVDQLLTAPRMPGYLEWLRTAIPASWTLPPHIQMIAEHLDAVTAGEIDRLAIFEPPRHGKSETVTIRYPVYRLLQRPESNVLVTGYNSNFARRFTRKSRDIYAQFAPLAGEKAEEWYTRGGGMLMARGVGSPPTGSGFGLICIDDPVRSRQDADSETIRTNTNDWYFESLYNRLEPGGAIVLTMTRWHEDDLGAQAVASEPGRWTILRMPALAESGDPMGRAPGAALWPERWPREALLRVRDVMNRDEGLRGWESLYQQNPTPPEGDMFHTSALRIVAAAPAGCSLCRAWDLGATENSGDWTVGVLMGHAPDGTYGVLNVVRGRWDADGVRSVIRQTAALDGAQVPIHLPQDPGQAGKAQAEQMVRMLAGYQIKAERVTGPKPTRAQGLAAQVNAGNVWLVKGGGIRDLIEEMRTFPSGRHDDMIDAAADAFNALAKPRWRLTAL